MRKTRSNKDDDDEKKKKKNQNGYGKDFLNQESTTIFRLTFVRND